MNESAHAVSRDLFIRQRLCWLPTIWGVLLAALASMAVGIWLIHNLYAFLAPSDPIGSKILVIEGWLAPEELDQAVQTFKTRGYARVITTGGPVSGWTELCAQGSYAGMAAEYLVRQGIPRQAVIAVPSPASAQDRTYLSAVVLRDWAQQPGNVLHELDLFSSGAHARRSRMLFQMAFGPEVHIGILSARPSDFNPEAWWRTSSGVESMMFQSIGLLWVKLFFWPQGRGSAQEYWGSEAQ